MTLTKYDLSAIATTTKKIVDKSLDLRLDKAINKSLDKRLGPKLENLRGLIKDTIDQDETLVRKDDIKNLPTKDEFFIKMDKLLVEVKASREEQSSLANRVSTHTDQIERIEKHVGLSAFDI